MKKTRRFAFLPVVLALILLLGGCAGKKNAGTSASSSAGTQETDGQKLSFTLKDYACSVTIPEDWTDICRTEVNENADELTFYSRKNEEFGGAVFAIWRRTSAQVASEDCFSYCDGSPVLLARDDDNDVSFYLVHPYTDVQYDAEDQDASAEYQAILNGEEKVAGTFIWQRAKAAAGSDKSAEAGNQTGSTVWKDAYRSLLEQTRNDYPQSDEFCQYTIYDMDGSGVPELLLKTGTCEADTMYSVYTFSSAAARKCGEFGGGHGDLGGLNGKGVVLQQGQMMYETITVYTLKDGTLSKPDQISKGEVQEYHTFDMLTGYELNDAAGLNWTANPKDSNQAVLDSLKTA